MNAENKPHISRWRSLEGPGSGMERKWTFPDGHTIDERKNTNLFITYYRVNYPDATKLAVVDDPRVPTIDFWAKTKAVRKNTLPPTMEFIDREQNYRLAIFAPVDGSVVMVASHDLEEYIDPDLRLNRTAQIVINYDDRGNLTEFRVRTDKPRDDLFPESDSARGDIELRQNLLNLLNYTEMEIDPGKYATDANSYYDQVESLAEADINRAEKIADQTIEEVINLLDPLLRETAKGRLDELNIALEISWTILAWIKKTGGSLEEALSKYDLKTLANKIIKEKVDDVVIRNASDVARWIIFRPETDEGFSIKEEEKDYFDFSRPAKLIQEGRVSSGESVTSQDVTMSISEVEGKIITDWRRRGIIERTATFPKTIPFDELRRLATDPFIDFRPAKELSGTQLISS